jgi:hypothetical protein
MSGVGARGDSCTASNLWCVVRPIFFIPPVVPCLWQYSIFFFPEDGVGLVPKRGCLLTLAYYAFPRRYEFGERRWNDILTGENRRTRKKKPVPVPLCPPQIPHGLTRARTGDSAVGGRRLTTWAMARSVQHLTQWNIITVASFRKNVYLSDEIWIQLKPSIFLYVNFLWSVLVPQ